MSSINFKKCVQIRYVIYNSSSLGSFIEELELNIDFTSLGKAR